MITIAFNEHCSSFKITNDVTFTEVLIMARNYDHEDQLVNETIKNLIENK